MIDVNGLHPPTVRCPSAASQLREAAVQHIVQHFCWREGGSAKHCGLCSITRTDHISDFCRFLEVIKFMGLDPPLRGFHEQLWIIIFVRKKRIERKTYRLAFLGNPVVTYSDCFGSK
ncbi:hypothetical protein GGQ68_003565 [Sagittula marina]|uniref:Uncharacterized protein n=1 Tax=Sagittula marina TaxID=943940 RepID=A0A7W6DR27_9RHOB|nr:hypothetical protein [Sagittula marina]